MPNKRVLGMFGSGSNHWVGDGFPVRNLFPSNGVAAQINPFLMLDYAGPLDFPPSHHQRGVGEHPHRGFETVTIAYQGSVAHRDSGGNAGVIYPGDVQWMTAASGVVHEELHTPEFSKTGGVFEAVQLWVNLPASHKMSAPRYQGIVSGGIPIADLGPKASGRVIAGAWEGVQGPAYTVTPINVFDLDLMADSRVTIPIPERHCSGVVLLHGDAEIQGQPYPGEAHIAVLSRDGDAVTLHAKTSAKLLILSGEPINEPVASYGPFVMNTREEIMQAMDDYRAGRMGHLS